MPKPGDSTPAGAGRIVPDHFHEGPAAAGQFDRLVRGVLSVPRDAVNEQRKAKPPSSRKARKGRVGGSNPRTRG
jgi:hypothetical protein